MSRPKVGLALGGGAARGLAHIGVLEVFQKEGIPIDMVAGTSIGAIIGGYYAKNKNVDSMRPVAKAFGLHKIRYFSDFTLPRTGIIKGRRIEEELKRLIGGSTEFHDLSIPFCCVAVDIDNGDEVVIRDGKVWEAVRASSSIPVIFPLVKWRGRNLVDGGLMNPVPTKTVKDMGADIVISVNVLPYKGFGDKREPSMFSIMMKSFYILDAQFIKSSLSMADVVIEPDVADISFTDFQRAEECIEEGAAAARPVIPEIKRKLRLA